VEEGWEVWCVYGGRWWLVGERERDRERKHGKKSNSVRKINGEGGSMAAVGKLNSGLFVKRLIDPEKLLTRKTDKIQSKPEKIFENKIDENPTSLVALFGNDYFLSPENVALYLDVSRKFIYEMIARGELKAVTVGGRLRRIRRSDLEMWLASANTGVKP
jgi:excisionase family DNA binding protein